MRYLWIVVFRVVMQCGPVGAYQPHGVTTQKTTIYIFTAVRNSNLKSGMNLTGCSVITLTLVSAVKEYLGL
jgi:hypothetical protein